MALQCDGQLLQDEAHVDVGFEVVFRPDDGVNGGANALQSIGIIEDMQPNREGLISRDDLHLVCFEYVWS